MAQNKGNDTNTAVIKSEEVIKLKTFST